MAPNTHLLSAVSSHSSITIPGRLRGDVSYTKQFDCTRAGFIIHHATVEVSDRRRLMSDQRSTSSHPGRESGRGGDRYEKRTWDREVLGGSCCRTPLDLIISMHGQEVRLSVGPGIRYERRSKKLIQIHNPWDNLVDIKKKMNAGITHYVSPFRLQPGVKSVQRGKLRQVWLHPKETWCSYGRHVITSQQPSDST